MPLQKTKCELASKNTSYLGTQVRVNITFKIITEQWFMYYF